MFATDDTIVAVASPPGRGGVGIVRLSGPDAGRIGSALVRRSRPWSPRRVTRAAVDTRLGRTDALLTFFAAPASYTGEDVLEIAAHGNPVVLGAIVEAAVAEGARAAGRGEFTLRAFIHGRIDLVQAEAVRDLVCAVSPAQVRRAADHLDGTLSKELYDVVEALRAIETRLEASIDFPDEGYRFIEPGETASRLAAVRAHMARLVGEGSRAELVRDGVRVVIAGAPNVGKSSVFNALLGAERAIVTPLAGTTRDLVSEPVVFGEALALLVDTAGLRASDDVVESEGIRRAEAAATGADLLLAVFDRSRPITDEERAFLAEAAGRPALAVLNKSDLAAAWQGEVPGGLEVCEISARTGAGVAYLVERIGACIAAVTHDRESVSVANARQRALVTEAMTHVDAALAGLARAGERLPEEIVIADVRASLQSLESVVGRRGADDLLAEIFDTFCIGK